jgi:hypothetical protein
VSSDDLPDIILWRCGASKVALFWAQKERWSRKWCHWLVQLCEAPLDERGAAETGHEPSVPIGACFSTCSSLQVRFPCFGTGGRLWLPCVMSMYQQCAIWIILGFMAYINSLENLVCMRMTEPHKKICITVLIDTRVECTRSMHGIYCSIRNERKSI